MGLSEKTPISRRNGLRRVGEDETILQNPGRSMINGSKEGMGEGKEGREERRRNRTRSGWLLYKSRHGVYNLSQNERRAQVG